MKINVNVSAVLGAGALVMVSVTGVLITTVWANDRSIAVHETKITGIEAMRPQLIDILIKVDSMEKSIREMRDARCNFKRKPKTEGE